MTSPHPDFTWWEFYRPTLIWSKRLKNPTPNRKRCFGVSVGTYFFGVVRSEL